MALVAMTTAHTVDFVSDMDPAKTKKMVPVDPQDPSKGEREEVTLGEDASVFKVRSLDVFLMAHIYDDASIMRGKAGDNEVGIHTRINKTNIDAVRFGLVSIPDNFRDKFGRPVRMKTEKAVVNSREYDVAVDDVLNALGTRLISEMASAIKENSEVSPQLEKNSERASSPSE